jgi:hypothetical protein
MKQVILPRLHRKIPTSAKLESCRREEIPLMVGDDVVADNQLLNRQKKVFVRYHFVTSLRIMAGNQEKLAQPVERSSSSETSQGNIQ